MISIVSCELLVDDRQVAFLAGDTSSNLHIFSYSPERTLPRSARGGWGKERKQGEGRQGKGRVKGVPRVR